MRSCSAGPSVGGQFAGVCMRVQGNVLTYTLVLISRLGLHQPGWELNLGPGTNMTFTRAMLRVLYGGAELDRSTQHRN